MSRTALLAGSVAILAGLGLVALSFAGTVVQASWLAGWLVVSAVPLGALPLVMIAEGLDWERRIPIFALRRLLWLMPLADLMAVPVFLPHGALGFDRPAPISTLGSWMAPSVVTLRAFVFLALWTILAWVFARPSRDGRPRTGLAIAGIGLHLVMVTVAAADWVGAADPDLNSSSLGLLVLSAQGGMALAAALVMTVRADRALPGSGIALAVLSAAWLFLHFTQYLVVWSANLPEEVRWYLHRNGGLGGAAVAAAAVVGLVAVGAGLARVGAGAWIVVAALLLAVHAAEMFWLVVPASRGSFILTLSDLLALAVVAGLPVAALAGWHPREPARGRTAA